MKPYPNDTPNETLNYMKSQITWNHKSKETIHETKKITPLRGKVRPHRYETVFLRVRLPNTALFTVFFTMFLRSARQKPLQMAMFLSWPWPKTPLFVRFFFQFRAKLSSLGNVQKHCKNQHFCPAKTAKNIPQRASKSQKLLPRPPDKTQRKKNTFQKRKKSTTKSEKTQVFFTFVLPVPGGRVHEHVHFVL